MSRLSPDDVITNIGDHLPAGSVLTSAVVIVAYVVPGEDDDERGPFLAWRTDQESGRWVHLGMVESCVNDFRIILGSSETDG